ncbi:MAG TPA: glycosyltransferase family 87 protein [Thermoanaerobaculales bacterium]|nr:glycosyltransferase family 87 protein [Thermoanaerobaculales bacterium]
MAKGDDCSIQVENADRLPSRSARRWRAALSIIAFLLAVIVPAVRVSRHMNIPGTRVDPDHWALVDFRDNVYYPAKAFLSGGNPYDRETHVATYPVRVRFPPYTPLFLLAHAPFGLLPQGASQLVYFVLTIALTVFLAHLTLRICGSHSTLYSVLGIAAMALLSRPGHWNLTLGQVTLEFVILAYVALHFGARAPLVSGLALAAATMKATIALPLVILMICCRYWRSVAIGTCIAVLATLPPTLVLVSSAGGVSALADSFLDSAAVFQDDESANPVLSSSRIDAVALVSRLHWKSAGPAAQAGILVFVVGTACAAIRRVRLAASGREADLYCFSIATLAILVPLYQQLYGALLLVLPMTALVINRWAPAQVSRARSLRTALIILLAVPAVNQLIAFRVLQQLKVVPGAWTFAVSINRITLILALSLYVVSAFKYIKPAPPSATAVT